MTLVAATVALFTSCSDDDDEVYPSISLSQRSVIASELGEQITVSYTGQHITSIAFSTIPDGWEINVNILKREIYLTAPTTTYYFDLGNTASDITITATSVDDNNSSTYLGVGTTPNVVDLSDMQSNSYVVSGAHTLYKFSALKKGETEQTISPSSASIIWQTENLPLNMARLEGDEVIFYVPNDSDDINENGSVSDVIEGNALIGAFDSEGNVLWSWHIWVSAYNPDNQTVTLNGATLMNRNLGANANANTSEEEILASYGMYYQWGRKEPFPAPMYYNAAYSYDATLYDEYGYSKYITYVESDSDTGTLDYATANPATYINGVEESSYDWLYSDHSTTLWGSTKSINDPCPKGWRVASPEAFETLTIPSIDDESIADLADVYGWTLTDGTESDLFMGLGRRGQITGRIQNVNTNDVRPAPWVGYYWSCDYTADHNSTSLYFAYDSESIEDCTIDASKSAYRATGMQIRCQRIE